MENELKAEFAPEGPAAPAPAALADVKVVVCGAPAVEDATDLLAAARLNAALANALVPWRDRPTSPSATLSRIPPLIALKEIP